MNASERIDAIKNGKPVRVVDIIVIVAVAVFALVWAVLSVVLAEKGSTVEISVRGTVSEYPLDVDREVVVDGVLTVVISGSEVYIKNAVCDDKVCEHNGRISRVNQRLICLPGGVIVTIKGTSDVQTDTN